MPAPWCWPSGPGATGRYRCRGSTGSWVAASLIRTPLCTGSIIIPSRIIRALGSRSRTVPFVIGGGLASLDVVKILMLETVTRALADRGRETDLYDLERLGIARVLGERGLTLADLGLRGCTLVYRRQVEDMPVANPRRTPRRSRSSGHGPRAGSSCKSFRKNTCSTSEGNACPWVT